MGILRDYFNQTRKPQGKLGDLMLRGMNSGHARLADWGLAQLPDITPERTAGFSRVETRRHPKKPWIALLAWK